MPCRLACLCPAFMLGAGMGAGMVSHVFFADKSSDDRVCVSFGGLVIGFAVFCRGFG